MVALVDCNSFYCSCERVFRPDLDNKPVVVLSNNDGCMIALSREAKEKGLHMAMPYFKAKEVIQREKVAVFSSNYNLYGDMSRRVMETLRFLAGAHNVEVYSVDEAFVNLSHIAPADLPGFARQIKQTVEQWTGIKVSVGVGPTKVLAKMANRLCKQQEPGKVAGVMVIQSEAERTAALQASTIQSIWGIGNRYAKKLRDEWCMATAFELSLVKEAWAYKNLGGVVGVRLVNELKGVPTLEMEDPLVSKKMIACTRMFGHTVTSLNDIREAIATYTARAAEKLRRQHCAAYIISAFVVSKEPAADAERFRHGQQYSAYHVLDAPTFYTHELIKPAAKIASELYKEGMAYKKAGVMLSGLVPAAAVQTGLFTPVKEENRKLMEALDNINFSMRDDKVKYATSGTEHNWKMQRNFHSPRYTTRWDELFRIS
jgi:DNA polymerase V